MPGYGYMSGEDFFGNYISHLEDEQLDIDELADLKQEFLDAKGSPTKHFLAYLDEKLNAVSDLVVDKCSEDWSESYDAKEVGEAINSLQPVD